MFLKCTEVYGLKPKGIFYDLGCGVGNLVYASIFLGNFARVTGVEQLASLLERGEKRASRWALMEDNFTQRILDVDKQWIEDDFVKNDFWTSDATFVLLHWTAFNYEERQLLTDHLNNLAEGAQVLSLTNPIPGNDYKLLVEDTCMTSWGPAKYFFQEKITRKS